MIGSFKIEMVLLHSVMILGSFKMEMILHLLLYKCHALPMRVRNGR